MVYPNFDYEALQLEHAARLERAAQVRLVRVVNASHQKRAKQNVDRLSDRVLIRLRYAFGV
ncbi:MAG: hypothetical protein R3264_12610 [Anaerolineae bacterium]|nr:hypothetical protein [Anaerolineae bacterium]